MLLFFVPKVVVYILTTDGYRVEKNKTRLARINKINFHTELRSRVGSCPVYRGVGGGGGGGRFILGPETMATCRYFSKSFHKTSYNYSNNSVAFFCPFCYSLIILAIAYNRSY